MLDEDLAELYGTTTKRLNEQVGRNPDRFPGDFVFRLTAHEFDRLRSQNATSSWGGRRYPPRAFTEHGVLALAGVLRTDVAAQASIAIVRTFVRMRQVLATHEEIARRLAYIEERSEEHDEQLVALFEAIHRLLNPPDDHDERERIGFKSGR